MDLKCIVIDDEKYAVEALVRYIEKMPGLVIDRTFTKPTIALAEIQIEDNVDIIFLDIEMPEISGLELAKNLRNKTKYLIFTTSHTKHALSAFDLNANQYLLKPITFSKFALTIDYIIANSKKPTIDQKAPKQQKSKLRFIKADQRNTYHYIDSSKIIYIQASKNYVIIHTPEEKYLTHMGLNHMEIALSKQDFIRIGKSHIIAKSAIKKIEGNSIRLVNNEVLQLGEIYKSNFLDFIKRDMLNAENDKYIELSGEK